MFFPFVPSEMNSKHSYVFFSLNFIDFILPALCVRACAKSNFSKMTLTRPIKPILMLLLISFLRAVRFFFFHGGEESEISKSSVHSTLNIITKLEKYSHNPVGVQNSDWLSQFSSRGRGYTEP